MEELKNETAVPETGPENTPGSESMAAENPALTAENNNVQRAEIQPEMNTVSGGVVPPPDSASLREPAAGQQTQQVDPLQQPSAQPQQTTQQLPPGYAVEPGTGRIVFTGQVYQHPQQMYQQPQQPVYPQPGVVYMPQPTPEELAAQQAAAQQRYGMIVNSVEQFMAGEATVSDVVKTLYTTTSQDDQLWKGVVVGAAAAVLLTSAPVREAMGKTLGGLFPGLKNAENAGKAAGTSSAAKKTDDTNSSTSTNKE